MEELQKTQEYAAERERRRMREQPYEGEERRKRENENVEKPDAEKPVEGRDV